MSKTISSPLFVSARPGSRLSAFVLLLLILLTCGTVFGQVQVTTQNSDNFRSGQNTNQTILTPSTVSSGQFGKLFSVSVDGKVYGQPLYMPNVTIPGKGAHNVVYVATEHDSVYALDADSNTGTNSSPLWQVSFINPSNGITPVSSGDANCTSVGPEVGVTSTPVIDPASDTIYVVVETKEHGQFFQRLHALDITTGAEKFSGPVTIQATYPGTGDGSSGGMLTFDPLHHLNRSGLLLTNGNVYITWGLAMRLGSLSRLGDWVRQDQPATNRSLGFDA